MTTVEVGRAAEQLACGWLQSKGFEIIDRNWRTRWCEIDIVARRANVIHFVEVKCRRRADFGDGMEAITKAKQARLQRAALFWLNRNPASGLSYQIDVIAITGGLNLKNLVYLADVEQVDAY